MGDIPGTPPHPKRVGVIRECRRSAFLPCCVSEHLTSIDRIDCSIESIRRLSSTDLPSELAGNCRLPSTRQSRKGDSYRVPLGRHGFCGGAGEELVCGALPGEEGAAAGFDEAAAFSLKSVAWMINRNGNSLFWSSLK
jgi:hypothetical protein